LFLLQKCVIFTLAAASLASPAFASRIHRAPTSGHATHGPRKAAAKAYRIHGQQGIDPARASDLQKALIREHYLTGEATGRWDAASIAAMQKYQADQGWQTKLMPDSRAIKKLGLGPDYSNAINAKNSSFAAPPVAGTTSTVQAEGFAQAAGVNR
jgi:hypothetical protein